MTTTALPCPEHGWRSQFCMPTGMLGWIVGHLMALKNRERSEWVLSRLNLDEDDRVLEIGFGPGTDVRRAARCAGHVTGIDPSQVMLNQARRRNHIGVEAGRVELRLGAMPVLPFARERFAKAFSINSFQFWPDRVVALCELRRVMTRGGVVAIAVQPRSSGATDDTAHRTGDEIAHALTSAGFRDVQLAFRKMKPVSTAGVIAKV